MGGYHAYDENGPLYPLHPKTVVCLVREGKLVPPTTEDLSNQSKGDFFSKGIAMLQAIWFVVQCIARLSDHLPLTNLEVMTLAYTVMTLAMYIAWWKKPLNISSAIRVPREPARTRTESKHRGVWDTIATYVMGIQDDDVNLHELMRVPTFWAGEPAEGNVIIADFVALLVAAVFGAIHCIALSHAFNSHIEYFLWRVSALSIIAIPIGMAPIVGLVALVDANDELSFALNIAVFPFIILSFLILFIGAPIYVGARAVLFFLSFNTLRNLPYPIFQAVQWTNFIPHI